jgi:uncharacterized membrane protein YphA (DoxX/SURF4 family)
MNTTTIRINWDFISRLFLGLLFVLAGIQKALNFSMVSDNAIAPVLKTGSLSPVVTAVVIFIEIVVASVYIFGKKYKDYAGYAIITFTVLATIFYHIPEIRGDNISAIIGTSINTLKNLAIVGGLIATLDMVHKRRMTK